MTNESSTFFDLIPFTTISTKLIKTPEVLKKVYIAGIRKNVAFYAANQSDKCVQMIRWGYDDDVDRPPYYAEEKMMVIARGMMLPICKVDQFDKLFKGVLNEIDLYVDIDGFDELIEYQQQQYLYDINVKHGMQSAPSDFKDITFNNVFIRNSDLDTLKEIINSGPEKKKDKQTLREEAFIDWLKDKDHIAVSNMKKDDVWAELQQIDRRLFNAASKTFFRVQQIITFKHGRKSK